jgi:hypothetical protein
MEMIFYSFIIFLKKWGPKVSRWPSGLWHQTQEMGSHYVAIADLKFLDSAILLLQSPE